MKSVVAVIVGLGAIHAQAAVATDVIQPSDLTMHIVEYTQIPASHRTAPMARIAQMKPVGDGSKRVAVSDLNGFLYLLQGKKVNLYLDFVAEIGHPFMPSPGLNSGLSSVAFAPDFARTGKFYTVHSESAGSGPADFSPLNRSQIDQQGVLLEWTAKDPKANKFEGTRRELMRVDLVLPKHAFQEIAFNPNARPGTAEWGKLYVCLGEGATVEARLPENAHHLNAPFGALLRIDPKGKNSANGKYGVPADNPFAADNKPETLGEIWAWGFRNPHRISWDKPAPVGDGKLLLVDIGERNWEEINLIERGRDYGWNVREGTNAFDPSANADLSQVLPLPADDAKFGFTYPVAQYSHKQGRAIAGGHIFRGKGIPSLNGKFIFGDIVSGRLFFVDSTALKQGRQEPVFELNLAFNGKLSTMGEVVGDRWRQDIRFGHDEDDNIYILEKRQGKIYRVVPPPGK